MAKRVVDDTSLTAVADAIRSKAGTSEALAFPGGFVSAVEGIEAGGSGGGGFKDGNLLFSEHTVTVEEGNGVTNHANLIAYFYNKVGKKTVFAYSLIGYADTYNQAIFGAGVGASDASLNIPVVCYRYRNGYVNTASGLGNQAYDAALVVGTQYKVYCVERIE
ncbi:MAG: hypothetical protein J6V25_04125 [Oscillospiraceae bacterium]|nr:hypothetical protein [Oscillospiraceae bacterium]